MEFRRRASVAAAMSVAAVCLSMAGQMVGAPAAASTASSAVGTWIVQGPSASAAAAAVRRAGGEVLAPLPLVAGVKARMAPAEAERLEAEAPLHVTPDIAMKPTGAAYTSAPQAAQLAALDLGPDWSPTAGTGVGVALIDTGVAPSPGFDPGHVVYGPDFSGSGIVYDHYGHGTFMAGLIVGNGRGGPSGVAPGSTLVSVKVAGADGSTTLSEVIQGIGWAVANRDAYNIRVMSISLGATVPLPPGLDPLDAAVEAAWASGITVVAASGNDGAGQVTAPGDDPWVVTVGAETTATPFAVPTWSGSSTSKPDILSPGVNVVSLRAPGSTIDVAHPSARVGSDYFEGSGTSMATALAAGAVAVLVQHHPGATPDDFKGALTAGSGAPLVGSAGPVDVSRADSESPSPLWWQHHPVAFNGLGRGVTSMPWANRPWTDRAWSTMSWSTMSWSTMSWSTMSWATMSWATMSWATMSWATMSWADSSWP